MNHRTPILAIVCAMAMAAGAAADAIIDVPYTNLQGSTGEHPSAYGYRGSSFIALDEQIDSLSYRLRANTPSPDPDMPVKWRLLITETNFIANQWRPSTVLYESPTMTHNSLGVVTFTHSNMGVNVTPGQQYAFLLDTYVEWDGVLDGLDLGINTSDVYAGGFLMYHYCWGSTATRASHFANGYWQNYAGNDVAFTMTFVPEPTALGMLGLGGLVLLRRRRTADR